MNSKIGSTRSGHNLLHETLVRGFTEPATRGFGSQNTRHTADKPTQRNYTMKANSVHGNLAIDILSGHVERILPQVRAGSYGRTANRIDRSQTDALCTTNTSAEQQPQASRISPLESCPKDLRIRQQNTSENGCTDLSGSTHFTSVSKDSDFQHPATNFGTARALISACPNQENSVVNGKSARDRFSEMQYRQDVPFFGCPRPVGDSPSAKTRVFIWLYMNNHITTHRTHG